MLSGISGKAFIPQVWKILFASHSRQNSIPLLWALTVFYCFLWTSDFAEEGTHKNLLLFLPSLSTWYFWEASVNSFLSFIQHHMTSPFILRGLFSISSLEYHMAIWYLVICIKTSRHSSPCWFEFYLPKGTTHHVVQLLMHQ